MKKLLCVMLAVNILLAFTGCATIRHEKDTSVKLYMVRDSITVTEELTGEEAEVILDILNGKKAYGNFLSTRWSCPFGFELAIRIDETVYLIAQDDCNVIWQEKSTNVYRISAEEKETLEQIFLAHGSEHRN